MKLFGNDGAKDGFGLNYAPWSCTPFFLPPLSMIQSQSGPVDNPRR